MRKIIPALIAVGTFLFSPSSHAAAGPPGKIKLLIIEGVSNHDWHHRLALGLDFLAKVGGDQVCH